MRIAGVSTDITFAKVLEQKRDFMKRNRYTRPTTLYLSQIELEKLDFEFRTKHSIGVIDDMYLKDGDQLAGLIIKVVEEGNLDAE
jgi:hypothetical protein